MNDWCFRPRFCTVKAILGRRQPGRRRNKVLGWGVEIDRGRERERERERKRERERGRIGVGEQNVIFNMLFIRPT